MKNMKKKLSLLLIPAMALSLTACGSSGAQTSSTPTPSPTTTITATPSPSADSFIEEVVFDTTVEEVISVLATNVEGNASVSPLSITPETMYSESSGIAVAGTYYSYVIHDGFSVNILDSAQTGKVQSVSVIASTNKLTKDIAHDLGCYQAVLVAMFEPDQSKWEQIDADLNIANASLSEDNIYFSTGTVADYLYTISDGITMLMISPK